MFLVGETIPTEPIWAAFMASAAELELQKRIPPTRPGPPNLFPEIPRHEAELETTCWRHGGITVPLVVPPRPRFRGAPFAPPSYPLRSLFGVLRGKRAELQS